jgi:putative redox protein
LSADEPLDHGGDAAGLTPYDVLLARLGACTSITINVYAEHKQFPLQPIEVTLWHGKIYARDCKDCEINEGKIDGIERAVVLQGDLDESQRTRLLEIADRCPVHRTLLGQFVSIRGSATDGQGLMIFVTAMNRNA